MTADERYLLLLYRSCDKRGKDRILATSRIHADFSAEDREQKCFLGTTTKKHVTEDGRQNRASITLCVDFFNKKG